MKSVIVFPAPATDAAQVWSLSANDLVDDDLELINDDELLDEDDLKKPDPSSLRGNPNFFSTDGKGWDWEGGYFV